MPSGNVTKVDLTRVLSESALIFSRADTKLEDVAYATRVPRPLLVYHFGTKKKLYNKSLEHAQKNVDRGHFGENNRYLVFVIYDLVTKRDLSGVYSLLQRFFGESNTIEAANS